MCLGYFVGVFTILNLKFVSSFMKFVSSFIAAWGCRKRFGLVGVGAGADPAPLCRPGAAEWFWTGLASPLGSPILSSPCPRSAPLLPTPTPPPTPPPLPSPWIWGSVCTGVSVAAAPTGGGGGRQQGADVKPARASTIPRLPVATQLPRSPQHLKAAAGSSSQPKVQGLLLSADKLAASGSPHPPSSVALSPSRGPRDGEDPSGSLESAGPPWQPGHGPQPSGRQGHATSFPCLCARSPPLSASGSPIKMSPQPGGISSPCSCSPLAGNGCPGSVQAAGSCWGGMASLFPPSSGSLPAPQRGSQPTVLPQDCSRCQTRTGSGVPTQGGKPHGTALSAGPAPRSVPAPCSPQDWPRLRMELYKVSVCQLRCQRC